MSCAAGPNISKSGLILVLDAMNKQSYPGVGTVWYDISGRNNNFNIVATAYNSSGWMDFNGSYGIAKNSANISLSGDVTYICVTRIKNSSADWRTLTRAYSPGDHHVIVQQSFWNIGMYDNDTNQFISSGASQQNLPGYTSSLFDVMIWRFTNSDNPTYNMNVNGNQFATITNTNARYNRGFGAIGGYHFDNTTPSSASQYWGDINYFAVYNRRLSDSEVIKSYASLRGRFNR